MRVAQSLKGIRFSPGPTIMRSCACGNASAAFFAIGFHPRVVSICRIPAYSEFWRIIYIPNSARDTTALITCFYVS